MKNPYKINIDGIGPILLERSRRAKSVIIYIRPIEGIRVAVPIRISFKKALAFVYVKKQWIMKHVAGIEQMKNQNKAMANSFISIDKADAEKRLTTRLHYLAEKHGFTYSRVFIRNQRTRLGSCSNRNNISLNMKLVLLPEGLIDYVILHELVHTQIRNHSKRFWTALDKYVGNSKIIAKRLRMNYLQLF